MEYLLFFIVWLIGFAMSLHFMVDLSWFKRKYKMIYMLLSLLSWVALLSIFLYLVIYSVVDSIKEVAEL